MTHPMPPAPVPLERSRNRLQDGSWMTTQRLHARMRWPRHYHAILLKWTYTKRKTDSLPTNVTTDLTPRSQAPACIILLRNNLNGGHCIHSWRFLPVLEAATRPTPISSSTNHQRHLAKHNTNNELCSSSSTLPTLFSPDCSTASRYMFPAHLYRFLHLYSYTHILSADPHLPTLTHQYCSIMKQPITLDS